MTQSFNDRIAAEANEFEARLRSAFAEDVMAAVATVTPDLNANLQNCASVILTAEGARLRQGFFYPTVVAGIVLPTTDPGLDPSPGLSGAYENGQKHFFVTSRKVQYVADLILLGLPLTDRTRSMPNRQKQVAFEIAYMVRNDGWPVSSAALQKRLVRHLPTAPLDPTVSLVSEHTLGGVSPHLSTDLRILTDPRAFAAFLAPLAQEHDAEASIFASPGIAILARLSKVDYTNIDTAVAERWFVSLAQSLNPDLNVDSVQMLFDGTADVYVGSNVPRALRVTAFGAGLLDDAFVFGQAQYAHLLRGGFEALGVNGAEIFDTWFGAEPEEFSSIRNNLDAGSDDFAPAMFRATETVGRRQNSAASDAGVGDEHFLMDMGMRQSFGDTRPLTPHRHGFFERAALQGFNVAKMRAKLARQGGALHGSGGAGSNAKPPAKQSQMSTMLGIVSVVASGVAVVGAAVGVSALAAGVAVSTPVLIVGGAAGLVAGVLSLRPDAQLIRDAAEATDLDRADLIDGPETEETPDFFVENDDDTIIIDDDVPDPAVPADAGGGPIDDPDVVDPVTNDNAGGANSPDQDGEDDDEDEGGNANDTGTSTVSGSVIRAIDPEYTQIEDVPYELAVIEMQNRFLSNITVLPEEYLEGQSWLPPQIIAQRLIVTYTSLIFPPDPYLRELQGNGARGGRIPKNELVSDPPRLLE